MSPNVVSQMIKITVVFNTKTSKGCLSCQIGVILGKGVGSRTHKLKKRRVRIQGTGGAWAVSCLMSTSYMTTSRKLSLTST